MEVQLWGVLEKQVREIIKKSDSRPYGNPMETKKFKSLKSLQAYFDYIDSTSYDRYRKINRDVEMSDIEVGISNMKI